jgi:hypothetical protein
MATGTYGPNLSPPMSRVGWLRRSWKYLAVSALSLGAGAAMAGGGSGKTTTVTKQAAPVVHTKVVTHTKTVTPQNCKVGLLGLKSAALTLDQAYVVLSSQILASYKAGLVGGSVDAITAKVKHSAALVDGATTKVKSVTNAANACLNG